MEPVSNTLPILGFATRSYDAYGYRDLSIDGARTGFAGEISEAELPWYLLGERFYVPTLRRFLSPDAASPFEAGGLNRYAYCSGDPFNHIDPNGESARKWWMIGIGLAISITALVLSAGMLAGAVGAATIGTTISTSTMVTLKAAVVIDTVGVIAEIGAVVSEATGDETATKIFGHIDMGASVARIALGGGVTQFGKSLKVAERARKVVFMRATVATAFEFLTDIVQLSTADDDDKEKSAKGNRAPEDNPEATMIQTRSMRSDSSEAQGDRGSLSAIRQTPPSEDQPRVGISSWPGPRESPAASDVFDLSSHGFSNDIRGNRAGRNEFSGLHSENALRNLPREIERSILWSKANYLTGRSNENNTTISHPRENLV